MFTFPFMSYVTGDTYQEYNFTLTQTQVMICWEKDFHGKQVTEFWHWDHTLLNNTLRSVSWQRR